MKDDIVRTPEPDRLAAEVVDLHPVPAPAGVVLGIVRELRPTAFVAGWPPPSDSDDPNAA
jgi:hypothetical protein